MATNQTVSESSRAKRTKRVSTNQNNPQNPLVNLPEDIVENVFSFLPIKDAIEAGTVSTRFKRSWLLNRKFLFGRDFALRFRREELIELIDRLFNSHKGPQIHSFQLHIDPFGIGVWIDKWLRICIAKGIEDLEFYFLQPGYNLDADFIDSLKSLRTLKLVYCEIQLSPVLKSLKFLNTLVLWHLELTEVKLETLIFHCKLLEILDLCQCSKIRQVNIFARNHKNFKMLKIASCPDLGGIEIDAPTLGSVFYCGFIPRIRFGQGVSLNEAFFNFMPTRTYMPASEVEILVTDLHNVRVLTASALFLEALAARVRDGIFGEAKFRLWSLRELQLFMEGGIFCNPYDIVMFLKNCPCLEALFIDVSVTD
ncbi:putative FBD-associated F-box protein At1g61330 [Gastrolobium bilobum]|uniref:putative FBD-associated F-box protein At1g61330 n=1 Tax=Gastrolobium bilobum TaxID=150636 RepID=UPI002AB30042|nr:putative FBD-associated F-box protein At1g61330 [Gastrolobium bilobum]